MGIADAGDCLEAMKDQMSEVKSSGMLEGTDALVGGAIFIPPLLWAAAGRIACGRRNPASRPSRRMSRVHSRSCTCWVDRCSTILPYVPWA